MPETASTAPRLRRQLDMVRERMLAHFAWKEWLTLAEIKDDLEWNFQVFASEASISARLRDLRKPQHGGYAVEKRIRSGHLWEYRVSVKQNGQQELF